MKKILHEPLNVSLIKSTLALYFKGFTYQLALTGEVFSGSRGRCTKPTGLALHS